MKYANRGVVAGYEGRNSMAHAIPPHTDMTREWPSPPDGGVSHYCRAFFFPSPVSLAATTGEPRPKNPRDFPKSREKLWKHVGMAIFKNPCDIKKKSRKIPSEKNPEIFINPAQNYGNMSRYEI